MSDIQDLMKIGRELGYEGQELWEFVQSERKYQDRISAEAREDRGLEREWEKERQEREAALLNQRIELARLRENGECSSQLAGISVKAPDLPHFDGTKDDLDSYLSRFERFAVAAGWERVNWAIILSSHLQGVALEVFFSAEYRGGRGL
ncbi:hypothetical protein Pcinc_032667 [Petrolisthes cinctipes]|uniref:Uncharacterized protein n=1 Tax=Petrolisthes cinctipes TaxID=88211 RepID=A0AAE1ETX8_PETCI|nr:hypothetical protein Pcinc_032667 [Petrolisthes cinctipes]